jgi:hypothetical protein
MHSNKQGRTALLFAKFLVKRIICKKSHPLLVGDAERYTTTQQKDSYMNKPKTYVIKCDAGSYTINGNPATLTITPAKISAAIEKSDIPFAKKIILSILIKKTVDKGIVLLEELITKVFDKFTDDHELLDKFIEIINSTLNN